MNPFRFRLQAVLTLLEQAEQVAQRRLARALAVVDQAAADLRSADDVLVACQELQRSQLAAGARAEQLEQSNLYGRLLLKRRADVAAVLNRVQHQAELVRSELIAATQAREGMERLRSRWRQTYDYECARAEQKLLDELACRIRPFTEVCSSAGAIL